MKHKSKISVTLLISIFISSALATIQAPIQEEFKNLQILPKDISHDALDKIMEEDFSKGLGVDCGYCHAKSIDKSELDFVSDAKPEKAIARKMMTMTMDINERNFNVKHAMIGDSTLVIKCITCHREDPYPVNILPKNTDKD